MKVFKKILWWIIAIFVMVTIFRFSSEKAVESAGTSKRFMRVIIDILPFTKALSEIAKQELMESMDFIIRKCAHFTLYAVLGFSVFGAVKSTFMKKVKLNVIWSFIICVIYAISDEIHQFFVPGRACRVYDIFIDSFGSTFGISFFLIIIFLLNKFYGNKIKC